MPMQQQNSQFARRLGARVAAANAEHREKPVDTGQRRLPAGVKAGVAKLQSMVTREQEREDAKTPKGETYFQAAAVALLPKDHNGQKVEGIQFWFTVPLCDVPERKDRNGNITRKAETFEQNWYDFQNFFKLLKIDPPPATATGEEVQAYYFTAMKHLTDPARPVYVEFSTRGWTPPKTDAQPNPQEMVFEEWHGLASPEVVAKLNGLADPSAGVRDGTANGPPDHRVAQGVPAAQPAAPPHRPPPPPPAVATAAPGPSGPQGNLPPDVADEVASLVEAAMADPQGASEDGQYATSRLEELAWAAGWSKEQTEKADDWAHVGEMALAPPPAAASAPPSSALALQVAAAPAVGSRWRFAKRGKDGAKLKNNKGEEFPPQEVEVVASDAASRTCTVKASRDGKEVVDLRSKKPVAVKWEWLE